MCGFVLQRLMTVSRASLHLCEQQNGRCNADVRNSCARLLQINNCVVNCFPSATQSSTNKSTNVRSRYLRSPTADSSMRLGAQLRIGMCSSNSAYCPSALCLVLGVTADSKYASASATSRRPSPCEMGFRVGLRRSCKVRSRSYVLFFVH